MLYKDDIDNLKKEINETYKDSEKIKLEIEKLNTLFEKKKYDEVNSIISSLEDKKLTKDQVEIINGIKKKIKEENEVAISESLQYNQSKKYEYLQKLNKIEYEVSKISYDGDVLQMKEASSEVLKKWDDLLNEIYGVLKQQLSSSEMELLKKEQRQWISDRDFIAEEEASEFAGGTMEGLQYTETLGRITKERCYELVEIYMK